MTHDVVWMIRCFGSNDMRFRVYNPQLMWGETAVWCKCGYAYFGIHTPSVPSTFFTQIAKEVNCVLATVILWSLVIRHRNHPSCKINFPLKTRAMKGSKLTLILTSLALRIRFLCLSPPLHSPSMHHRRAGVHVIECDNKSKLYCRKSAFICLAVAERELQNGALVKVKRFFFRVCMCVSEK